MDEACTALLLLLLLTLLLLLRFCPQLTTYLHVGDAATWSI
jgi:hypothetical protein